MITTLQTFEHGRLDYDATVPCIILVQVGFMDSHEFRLFLNDGIKQLIEKKKVYDKIFWIADVREADAIALEDIEWVATDWTSRILSEGLTHMAFVKAKDEVANMSVTVYEESTQELIVDGKKMTIANFSNIEEAKEWFLKMAV